MKFVCGFIGWIVGMFLGFMVGESAPFLGIVFVIGGILLGRYIGGCIEEDRENQRRAKEDYERKRKQEEYNRQRKLQKKAEAQSLARKYPEATKHYFKMYWGITKTVITDYDITDDKVDALLAQKYSYERDEQTYNTAYKAKLEAERQAKIRKEAAIKEAERQAQIARERAEEQTKKALPTKVSQWNMLGGNFRYNYLLNYFQSVLSYLLLSF